VGQENKDKTSTGSLESCDEGDNREDLDVPPAGAVTGTAAAASHSVAGKKKKKRKRKKTVKAENGGDDDGMEVAAAAAGGGRDQQIHQLHVEEEPKPPPVSVPACQLEDLLGSPVTRVYMKQMRHRKQPLHVKVGDVVVFVGDDGNEHMIICQGVHGMEETQENIKGSRKGDGFMEYRHVFKREGTYMVSDQIFRYMKCKVEVEPKHDDIELIETGYGGGYHGLSGLDEADDSFDSGTDGYGSPSYERYGWDPSTVKQAHSAFNHDFPLHGSFFYPQRSE